MCLSAVLKDGLLVGYAYICQSTIIESSKDMCYLKVTICSLVNANSYAIF